MSAELDFNHPKQSRPEQPKGSALKPFVVVRPMKGWASLELGDLLRYRYLLFMLLWRDIKGRYRQTMLGPLWFVIGPLMRMVVYSLVLGTVARLPSEGIPYPLYTYSALLSWELFAGAVFRSTGSLVEYMQVISKVYFPRLIVPVTTTLSGVVDFSISFLILIAMTLLYGYPITLRILYVPLLLVPVLMLAMTIGMSLAALNVRFRDIGSLVGILLQFWFYATPVAYSGALVTERLPAFLRPFYELNPMAMVVENMRWAILGVGKPPEMTLVYMSLIILVCLIGAAFFFRRTEQSIVDIL